MSLTTRELAETISENNGRSIEENSEAIEAAARTYGLVLEPLPVGTNGEGIWSDYDETTLRLSVVMRSVLAAGRLARRREVSCSPPEPEPRRQRL
jgi:hypothetical protein